MTPAPRRHTSSLIIGLTLIPALAACQPEEIPAAQTPCQPGNGGLTLPDGFCAVVVTAGEGRARHIEVAPNGDVILAMSNDRAEDRSVVPGGVVVLRDLDGDGRADETHRFGANGGNEVLLGGDYLYFATDDAVLRYPFPAGSVQPTGGPDTLVSGLPNQASHTAKSLALGPGNALYVNIGSPSNACQEQPRGVGSPGLDPCPQRDHRAGIWRFDADRVGQVQEDGVRFATGLRNTVALRTHPSGALFGVVHGRDQLSALWNELYTEAESAEKPSEEFVRIEEGDDFGWPYCYHDPDTNVKVLAPEYGGDGVATGRCAEAEDPFVGFPGHWAPNDLEFYTGTQFPSEYRGGAFIAFHGSWNRAPQPQGGYNVVFAPFAGDSPTGTWEVFADGFAGGDMSPRGADHRPVGVAVGPDGSLFISDSSQGTVWKVMYQGN
jgi:glucose/arabinose dehydrogenase